MAEERIDIVVSEQGSRVVKRSLMDIGVEADKSASSVDFLKKALAGLGAAFGVQQLVKLTSAWSDLSSRINLAAGSAENASAVMERLQVIARRSYADLGSTAEIYLSNSTALRELGYSAQQTLDFTESMTNALVISGAKAERAETVINALSKAMMVGKLSGQNWATVLQQGGRVVEALAEGTGKSVIELRQMAAAGKLTSDTVFTALTGQLGKLQEEADAMPATITDALVVLKNRLMEVVGSMDQAGGFSEAVVKGLDLISKHLETVIKLAAGVAAGFLLIGGAAKAIDIARNAMVVLNAVIAANPIGFLLTVLTSVLATLFLFRDALKLGSDEVTSLGDLLRAFGETVGAVFSRVWEWAQETFGGLIKVIGDWFSKVDFSLVGILRIVAKVVDGYVGFWVAAVKATVALFKGLPAALGDIMTRALNVVLERIGTFVNSAGQLLSMIPGFAGLEKLTQIDLRLTNENEGAARKLGKDIGTAVRDGFNRTTVAADFLERMVGRAQEIGAARTAQGPAADLNQRGTAARVVDKNAEKEARKLQEALAQLVGTYDQVWKAQQEFADGIDLLDRALAAGMITKERYAEVLGLMKLRLADSLDPLGAVNRELDRERGLLKLTADARTIDNQVRAIQKDMLGQGIILGAEELKQLREKLELIQKETKAAEVRNQVYQAILTPQQEYIEQLKAINDLIAEGSITREQANAYLVSQNQELLEGTIEHQQAMVTEYEQTMARIDALRQADLISEQTAAQLKAKAAKSQYDQHMAMASQFFGNLSVLSRSKNREMAAIGKAAAVTQATIDGTLAVQKALASAPPPANYALAASIGVATAANVAQIMAQNTQGFAFGGDFTVGGTGGTDSQMVAFRATPGETVSVRTPTQNNDSQRQAGGRGAQESGGVRIVNVLDPAMVGDFLSSSEGEQVLVNTLRRNSDAVRQVLNA